MEVDEETRENIGDRIFKLLKKNKKKFMVLFLCIKEVIDCVLDWLLYREFSVLEPGLVYGPIDNSLLYSLLAICCIGMLVSFADLVNKLVEQCRGKPIVNIAYTEVCVVYLEDIPQLIIGFFIVFCTREDRGLLFVKTFILFLACGIGFSIMSIAVYNNDAAVYNSDIKFSTFRWLMFPEQSDDQERKCGGLLVIGYIVVFIISSGMVLLIGLTNMSIGFNSSKQILLDNVGIYVNPSDLELAQKESRDSTWIYLFDINDIKRHDEVMTKITMDPSHLRIQNFYTYENDTDTCYRLIETEVTNDAMFRREFNCSLLHGTEYYYSFKYLLPSSRHRLGDIQYNVRKTLTGSCNNATIQRSHFRYFRQPDDRHKYKIYTLAIGRRSRNKTAIDILYKSYRQGNHTYDEYLARSAIYRAVYGYTFHNAVDLSDVTHEWEKASCHKSDASPHFNQDIPVPCVL